MLAGLMTIAMGAADWRLKVALIFLPVALYGLMMLRCKFPVHERVAAGSSYREMLREFGILGALIVTALIVREVLGNVFYDELVATFGTFGGWPLQVVVIVVAVGAFALYARSLGRPMFIFLLLVMVPLATTEIGTDGWITSLMEPQMKRLGLHAAWVLVYTSFIMMVLRFFAGPIVHKLSPLGLLAVSSIIAAIGLYFLSTAAGIAILVAATFYGFGKTFFWPTMLGVVAEQFPKGGALTLNATGGVGMLGVGVLGFPLIGLLQENAVTSRLERERPALYSQVVTEKQGVLGEYQAVNPVLLERLSAEERETVREISADANQRALATMAIFPCIMLVCYLGLIAYFRAKGGYKAEVLAGHAAEDEKFTGGVEGPGEG